MKKKAFLLTCNENSERGVFSKNLLEKIGFDVIIQKAILHEDPVISNKISLAEIYRKIANMNEKWVYIFEDDINILEMFDINELDEYEKISKDFYYLGCCCNVPVFHNLTDIVINNHNVVMVKGGVRGTHAYGVSKEGAVKLYNYVLLLDAIKPADIFLDTYTYFHPTYVYRYDLESYIPGHRGIFFQDRKKFNSQLSDTNYGSGKF